MSEVARIARKRNH